MTTHAQTAQAIRKELKAKFPTITFSVRSSSYAGGDSVRIDYRNGVPSKDVYAIVNKYQEGHFNGMEDIYEYSNDRNDIPQVKYVLVQRDIDNDIIEATRLDIAKRFGIVNIDDNQEWGKIFNDYSARSSQVYRELADKTL